MNIKKLMVRICTSKGERIAKAYIEARIQKRDTEYDFNDIASSVANQIIYKLRGEIVEKFFSDKERVANLTETILQSMKPEKIIEDELRQRVKSFVENMHKETSVSLDRRYI